MVLAVILSLVAAALFAVASVLQAKGTESVPDDEAGGAGFMAQLVRRPVWVAGIAADIVGFGVQAWALAVGSLLLVQPLLVTTLLFALPLSAWTQKRLLTTAEWMWSAALIMSLIVFVLLGQPTAGTSDPSFRSWILPLMIITPIVAVCVWSSLSMQHGTTKSLVLALAAGLLLGVSAPLTKSGLNAFGDGLLAGVRSWQLWGMALTAALGTFWQQASYQAGDVQTSLPTVTVLKPVVAMAIGLTIYGEHLRVGTDGDIALFLSVGVMAVSTLALGRLAAPSSR